MESDLKSEVRFTLAMQVALKASHAIETALNQRVGWKKGLDFKVQ